jgi:hypothetical protein
MRVPVTIERRSFVRRAVVGGAGVVAGIQASGLSSASSRQVEAELEQGLDGGQTV